MLRPVLAAAAGLNYSGGRSEWEKMVHCISSVDSFAIDYKSITALPVSRQRPAISGDRDQDNSACLGLLQEAYDDKLSFISNQQAD